MSAIPYRKTLHFILSGKGGVGKTVVARIVSEYVTERCVPPLCFDTDQTNAVFAAVPAFNVEKVDLFDGEDKLNPSRFDRMMGTIIESNLPVVIDSGSSSYFETLEYIAENDLIETLHDAGFDVFLHCIVTGGAAMRFTVGNCIEMAEWFGERANICVWVNHFWEPVQKDGKPFIEWREFVEHEHLIAAVMEIPRMNSQMTQADFSLMLKENLSFAEATAPDSHLNTMQRSRLMRVRRTLFGAMDSAFGNFRPETKSKKESAKPPAAIKEGEADA